MSALTEAQRRALGRRPSTERGPRIATGDPSPAPLSAEQEQIVFDCLLSGGATPYNETVAITKLGHLEAGALEAALNDVVERHHIWRTVFRRERASFSQVVQPYRPVALTVIDLTEVDPGDREEAAIRVVADQARPPFDLRVGPLVRALLIRMGEAEHRLHLALHHVIFDGVSLAQVVLPELVDFYELRLAGATMASRPVLQYADYARWQASGPLDAALARHLPYWRTHLAGIQALTLPARSPQLPPAPPVGGMDGFIIPGDLVPGLRSVAGANGASLFHVLAAAYAIVQHQLSNQDGSHHGEVVFATVADLRRHRDLERMVGYCLTPIVLRVGMSDPSVEGVIAAVRHELLSGLEHLLPFERIVRNINADGNDGRDPLFQSMIVLQPPAAQVHPEWELHPLDIAVGRELGNLKTDLLVELDERPEGHLLGRCGYNKTLFGEDFGTAVITRLLTVLHEVAQVGGPRR